jgi:hypothetical protein
LVGGIEAGKPGMVVGILSLTPGLQMFFRVSIIRSDKIKAAPGSGGVFDSQGQFFVSLAGCPQVYLEPFSFVAEFERFILTLNRNSFHHRIIRVKSYAGKAIIDRAQGGMDYSGHSFSLKVQSYIQKDMFQSIFTVWGIVGLVPWQGKRAKFCPCLSHLFLEIEGVPMAACVALKKFVVI